jgi:phosphoglycolate phosphatase
MAMPLFKVVAFDCDGVLFDSIAANQAYYNQILTYFNRPTLSAEQNEFTRMHTVDEVLSYLFEDPEILTKVRNYQQQVTYFPFIKDMEIEPDMQAVVSQIQSGSKTAIATNRTNTMQRVLEEHNVKSLFDLIICASDVTHPKPHPEMLLKILEHYNIASDQMVYIGDSQLDEMASKAARVPFIAYKNATLKAIYHIESFKSLARFLELPMS